MSAMAGSGRIPNELASNDRLDGPVLASDVASAAARADKLRAVEAALLGRTTPPGRTATLVLSAKGARRSAVGPASC